MIKVIILNINHQKKLPTKKKGFVQIVFSRIIVVYAILCKII